MGVKNTLIMSSIKGILKGIKEYFILYKKIYYFSFKKQTKNRFNKIIVFIRVLFIVLNTGVNYYVVLNLKWQLKKKT